MQMEKQQMMEMMQYSTMNTIMNDWTYDSKFTDASTNDAGHDTTTSFDSYFDRERAGIIDPRVQKQEKENVDAERIEIKEREQLIKDIRANGIAETQTVLLLWIFVNHFKQHSSCYREPPFLSGSIPHREKAVLNELNSFHPGSGCSQIILSS